jgi:stalled ribosome rescue protein Dom34
MLPIFKLSETTEFHKNHAYFSTIISSAKVKGPITELETKVLFGLAGKLNISEENSMKIIKNTFKLSVEPLDSYKDRLVFLYDFLKLIYPHEINDDEVHLINFFTQGIGFSPTISTKVASKSINIFKSENGSENYFNEINTYLSSEAALN